MIEIALPLLRRSAKSARNLIDEVKEKKKLIFHKVIPFSKV